MSLMRKQRAAVVEIQRAVVERTAAIMGPHSAAAQALAQAAGAAGPVRFLRIGNTLLVEEGFGRE